MIGPGRDLSTELSCAELAEQCDAARDRASPAIRIALTPQFEKLRQRYTQTAQLAKTACADPRMRWPALRRAAEPLVAFGWLAHRLLADFDAGSEEIVRPAVVERAVAAFEKRARSLTNELALLDRLELYAEEAASELVPLVVAGTRPMRGLDGLLRRVLLDVRNDPEGRLPIPVEGLPIGEILAGNGRPEFACLTPGLLAARLAAWVCPQYFAWSEATDALVLASLMQDLSLAFSLLVRRMPLHEQPAESVRRHPRLSAALAEGLDGAPLMVPGLIATHHERSNGAGFPAGRTQWTLSPLERLGAVIARFVELRHGPFFGQSEIEDLEGGRTTEQAARRLLDEAERGTWDLLATRGLLKSLDALPPDRALDDAATTALPAMTVFGHRRLRLDSAHSGSNERQVPAPHFARSGRQTRIEANPVR